MSNHLGYVADSVPLGASIADTQGIFISVLTSYGWRVVKKSLVPQSLIGSMTNLARAFDNSDWMNGECGDSSALPKTVGVLMAVGVVVSSYEITGSNTPSQSPKNWVLEYSDDGISWTVADTIANQTGWIPKEVRSFTISGSPGSHAYWRLNISATQGGTNACYLSELRMNTTSGFTISNICYAYFIPPAGEDIGNAYARDLIYMTWATTTMTIQPVKQMLQNVPSIVGVYEKTGGAVAASLTIDGVTVTGSVGSSVSSAKDNLYSLYAAIKASSDPAFTGHKWIYQRPSPMNAQDTNDWIIGVKQADVAMPSYSVNANVNMSLMTQRTKQTIQTQAYQWAGYLTLSIDLTNGFIYFMQVNSRSIAIATKTNTGLYGPIHACYADNTKALACMPESIDPLIITTMELWVGTVGSSSEDTSTAYPACYWKIPVANNTGWVSTIYTNGYSGGDNVFGGGRVRDMFTDGAGYAGYSDFEFDNSQSVISKNFYCSSSFNGGAASDDFQIHRMGDTGVKAGTLGESYPSYNSINGASYALPIVDIQDWYKNRGTFSNEALCLVADTVNHTTLSAGLSSSATTINVGSTAGFAPIGYVVINQELIQYTGMTGTSFTGCTRGCFGTKAVQHYDADNLYQGIWFTIINGGALMAGYTKPA